MEANGHACVDSHRLSCSSSWRGGVRHAGGLAVRVNGAAGQTALRCEPGQHAVVNQAFVDGATVTSVSCAADVLAPVATQPALPRGVPDAAGCRTSPPCSGCTGSGPPPSSWNRKPRRTWQKRALVIGGSSGAGAGIGALIGGKKGALIGAAIGGGAGTVYEMQK